MDMDDTNDGEAVPMTKEAVVDALKADFHFWPPPCCC